MAEKAEIIRDLKEHNATCRQILALVQDETRVFHHNPQPGSANQDETKKRLLHRLKTSMAKIHAHRVELQKARQTGERLDPEIGSLIRQGQTLIMKIVVLDRENEKLLMKQGMLPPTAVPSVFRERPDAVAKTYQQGPR